MLVSLSEGITMIILVCYCLSQVYHRHWHVQLTNIHPSHRKTRSQGATSKSPFVAVQMQYPLVMTNITIENGHLQFIFPFIMDIFPILNYQRVHVQKKINLLGSPRDICFHFRSLHVKTYHVRLVKENRGAAVEYHLSSWRGKQTLLLINQWWKNIYLLKL